MSRNIRSFLSFCSFKDFKVILAFFWSFSLTTGVLLGFTNALPHCFVYLNGACSRISFIGIVSVRCIFLTIVYLLTHRGYKFAASLFLVIRGLLYGMLLGALFSGFGYAGWLICILLGVSNSVSAVVELYFFFSLIDFKQKSDTLLFICVHLVVVIVSAFDLIYLSNFLSKIIIYY